MWNPEFATEAWSGPLRLKKRFLKRKFSRGWRGATVLVFIVPRLGNWCLKNQHCCRTFLRQRVLEDFYGSPDVGVAEAVPSNCTALAAGRGFVKNLFL